MKERDITQIKGTVPDAFGNFLPTGKGRSQLPILLLFVVISLFHLWRIPDVPKGLYRDELSIGYNALLVSRTGHDEHNQFFPVYFKAFGDFKNPLYIYAVSLVFKVFGVSEYGLRATSFLFFFLFLAGFYLLVTKVFRENRIVSTYALLSAGFLPWFFTVSRISFEVISQLTVVVYSLLFIYMSYHAGHPKRAWLYPSLAGVFLGLSVYTYATARLLSFLLLLSVVLIYLRRDTVGRSVLIMSAFFLSVIPYGIFAARNPDALTARFAHVSYVYNRSKSVIDKATIFLKKYAAYFGPDFLVFRGDRNVRHATGYGGELLIIVFILFAIGLAWVLIRKRGLKDKFVLLMFVNLLLSPAAGSLTKGPPHALRGILLGLYIVFFSCYGLACLLETNGKMRRNTLVVAVFAVLLLQVSLYMRDYFTTYERKSVKYFETYGFGDALAAAIAYGPEKIVVSNTATRAYVYLAFYASIVPNPRHIPVSVDTFLPRHDTCIIYFARDDPPGEGYPCKFEAYDLRDTAVRLRCY